MRLIWRDQWKCHYRTQCGKSAPELGQLMGCSDPVNGGISEVAGGVYRRTLGSAEVTIPRN